MALQCPLNHGNSFEASNVTTAITYATAQYHQFNDLNPLN